MKKWRHAPAHLPLGLLQVTLQLREYLGADVFIRSHGDDGRRGTLTRGAVRWVMLQNAKLPAAAEKKITVSIVLFIVFLVTSLRSSYPPHHQVFMGEYYKKITGFRFCFSRFVLY